MLDAKKERCWGLVFANSKRLPILQHRGYLTQFDYTHKMNKWKHDMFSFLVGDENGVFIPAAHCVVDLENSEALGRAMECKKLPIFYVLYTPCVHFSRNFLRQQPNWSLVFFDRRCLHLLGLSALSYANRRSGFLRMT